MLVWRLIKTKYARTAFDGEGARLYGGRWSSPGTLIAYASDSSALAVLEVIVHLKDEDSLSSYSLVTASIPESLVETIDFADLTRNWNSSPVPPAVQAIGDQWIRNGDSLALRVPSAIVAASNNILINPHHSSFRNLTVEAVEPFTFDKRLFRRRGGPFFI